MFSPTLVQLTTQVHKCTTSKTVQQLADRAYSLGIPIKQDYTRERIIFIIAQTLVTLIDEPEHPTLLQEQNGNIEGNSTLRGNRTQSTGNMHIAALIMQNICPKLLIWDCLQILVKIKASLHQEDWIIEHVTLLPGKVSWLSSLTHKYYCHCLMGQSSPSKQSVKCQQCLSDYHPDCQANVLFCNACLLRHHFSDLAEDPNDPFATHKNIQEGFFSYLPHPPSQPGDHVYFHVASFSFPHLQQQADRRQQSLVIKLCAVDRIFPQEVQLGQINNNIKQSDFWEIEGVQYSFYLNHNELKIPGSLSRTCIVLKAPLRLLQHGNNILVIRCCKRSHKLKLSVENLAYWPEQPAANQFMLGIYHQDSSIKKRALSANVLGQALGQLTLQQAYYHLQYILTKVNRIDFQFVDLIDPVSHQKIVNPVRSYGCDHIQCFDFQEFRKTLIQSKMPLKRKMIRKQSRQPVRGRYQIQEQVRVRQQVIEIDLNSVQIIQVEAQQIVEENRENQTVRSYRRRKNKDKQSISKPSLKCPICHRKLLTLYQDPLFLEILRNSGFYKRVKVYSSGQYCFDQAPHLLLD